MGVREPWTMSVALAAKLTNAPLDEVALADMEIGQVIVGAVVSAAGGQEKGS